MQRSNNNNLLYSFIDKIESNGFGPLVEFVDQLIPFDEPNNNEQQQQQQPSLAKLLATIRRRTGQNYMVDLQVAPDYMNTTYNTILVSKYTFVILLGTFLENLTKF